MRAPATATGSRQAFSICITASCSSPSSHCRYLMGSVRGGGGALSSTLANSPRRLSSVKADGVATMAFTSPSSRVLSPPARMNLLMNSVVRRVASPRGIPRRIKSLVFISYSLPLFVQTTVFVFLATPTRTRLIPRVFHSCFSNWHVRIFLHPFLHSHWFCENSQFLLEHSCVTLHLGTPFARINVDSVFRAAGTISARFSGDANNVFGVGVFRLRDRTAVLEKASSHKPILLICFCVDGWEEQ